MLTIDKTLEGGELTCRLEGRLDTITAPDLERELKESPEDVNTLVLDLGKLEYISSAGLRVLLSTHKRMARRGGMKLIHVNEIVTEILEVTGFTDILTIA